MLIELAAALALAAQGEDPCAIARDRVVRFSAEPGVARQGETLTLGAYVMDGPYGPKSVPMTCMTDWRLVPENAASLSPDRSRLAIAPDAVPGSELLLTAEGPGGFSYRAFRVIGRDEVTLTGFWRQQERNCEGEPTDAEPVRELEFSDNGDYSITWLPFETYKDYWGVAVFDVRAGTLAFTRTGGNFSPRDADLEGQAQLDAQGRLILEGVYFGTRDGLPPIGTCRYVFVKAS